MRLKSGKTKQRKMVSILTKHLKENHDHWIKVLKEEEDTKRREEKKEGKDDGGMAPIWEDSEERNSDDKGDEDDRPAEVTPPTEALKGATERGKGQEERKVRGHGMNSDEEQDR